MAAAQTSEAQADPRPSTSDPIGMTLASIGAGATTGAVLIVGGALALRVLQAYGGETTEQAGFSLIAGSAVAGLLVAVATGWVRTRTIPNTWRRGVAAALAGFGSVMLALVAAPADLLAGPIGIGGYVLGLVAALVWCHRAAARLARTS